VCPLLHGDKGFSCKVRVPKGIIGTLHERYKQVNKKINNGKFKEGLYYKINRNKA